MARHIQANLAGQFSFMVLIVVSTLVGKSLPPNSNSSLPPTNSPTQKTVSASAIWVPGPDFLRMAQAACDNNQSDTPAGCLINQMAKADAPDDAVQFSRQLYRQNGGEFGVMWLFKKLGPVDMAYVLYPLRDVGFKYAVGSTRVALLLVNGAPAILDVDDLTMLDRKGLQEDKSFQALRNAYPNLDLWGGGRGGTAWVPVRTRPDGGQTFDIYYALNPGRPAGRWLSGAHFDWNFDASGKFLGTKFTGGVGLLPD